MVITGSLSEYNAWETLSTCRFGLWAKSIKNNIIQNVEWSAKELLSLLEKSESKVKKYEDLIWALQAKLKAFLENQSEETWIELEKVVSSKDMDFIYSLLNGGSINSKILDSNEEDDDEIEANESTASLTSK